VTTDWQTQAACRGEDPELFFPLGTTGPAAAQAEEAKAVCRRCPAMNICLTWALTTGQDFGVWGGHSEDERRAIKRRAARKTAATPRQPARCGTPAGYEKHVRDHSTICGPCRAARNAVALESYHRTKQQAA